MHFIFLLTLLVSFFRPVQGMEQSQNKAHSEEYSLIEALDNVGNLKVAQKVEIKKIEITKEKIISKIELNNYVFKLPSMGITSIEGISKIKLGENLLSGCVESIYLHKNLLEGIPSEISLFTRLKNLNFKKNKLARITPDLSKLTDLFSLDVSYNMLRDVPEVFLSLTKLDTLNISNNSIEQLPRLEQCKKLARLNVADNKLSTLQAANTQDILPISLQSLVAANNRISSLPSSINTLTNLRYVNLSQNAISEWPDTIGNHTNLIEVNLAQNSLSAIPRDIYKISGDVMCRRVIIDLSGNQIEELPAASFHTNLHTLRMANNQISVLRGFNKHFKFICELDFSRNKLTGIPDELGQLSSLMCLYLAGNQLTEIPESLTNCTNLRSLDLSHNNLTSLCTIWRGFVDLHSLNLSHNRLTKLPDDFGRLGRRSPALIEINLSHNQLGALPRYIRNSKRSYSLNISSNRIKEIFATVGHLQSISDLNLSNNPVTKLSSYVGTISRLRSLNVASGQLKELPLSIGMATKLCHLNCNNNYLTNLPTSLRNLTQLTQLQVLDNDHQLVSNLKNNTALQTLLICLAKAKSFYYGNLLQSLPRDVKTEVYKKIEEL